MCNWFKSDEIVATLLQKLPQHNLHCTIRISLIFRTMENIKKYCEICEIINKLFFIKKHDFIHFHDFFKGQSNFNWWKKTNTKQAKLTHWTKKIVKIKLFTKIFLNEIRINFLSVIGITYSRFFNYCYELRFDEKTITNKQEPRRKTCFDWLKKSWNYITEKIKLTNIFLNEIRINFLSVIGIRPSTNSL